MSNVFYSPLQKKVERIITDIKKTNPYYARNSRKHARAI